MKLYNFYCFSCQKYFVYKYKNRKKCPICASYKTKWVGVKMRSSDEYAPIDDSNIHGLSDKRLRNNKGIFEVNKKTGFASYKGKPRGKAKWDKRKGAVAAFSTPYGTIVRDRHGRIVS